MGVLIKLRIYQLLVNLNILKFKPGTNVYLSVFFCLFNVFSYIHEYANEIICIFIIGSTSYISSITQLLFGTMFGSPGYMAAEIYVIL